MCRRVIILVGCVLGLASRPIGVGAQPVPLPQDPRPADPLAGVASGTVSLRPTPPGFLVVANLPANRFTFEVKGKKIEPHGQKVGAGKYQQLWVVDGILLQALALPWAEKFNPPDAEQALGDHQKYETDYQLKLGWVEVASARKWLRFPTGQPVLYWELGLPKSAGEAPTRARKMLFASTLNGRNVILLTVTVFAKDDETTARKLLIDAIMSVVRHEKNAVGSRRDVDAAILGDDQVILLNDELATRKDRKAPGAVVLQPKQLLLILRIVFELEPPRAGAITFVLDGYKAHVVTLDWYDQKTKCFAYGDTTGKHSFLEENNNRAGVKARWDPALRLPPEAGFGSRTGSFVVSDADLQKVVEGVIVHYRDVRFYFGTADLKKAVKEYSELQRRFPKLKELKEARLRRTGQLLAEGGENVRAVNLYLVCLTLHPHSARALAGVAGIYAKTGQTGQARNFYADALKALANDKSLTEPERRQLGQTWEAARGALAAKP
jgi:tetratricopeptide (TPR) repeat protein